MYISSLANYLLYYYVLPKIIEGPILSNVSLITLNIKILQNKGQIVLLFMAINEKSVLPISMPMSVINVSQMHQSPPHTHTHTLETLNWE